MTARMLWITADPLHIAQIASWTEETDDGLVAHFSGPRVRDIRDFASEVCPAPRKLSGREQVIRLSFDTVRSRVSFALAVLELGGEIVPQFLLPASATAELVP